MNSYKLNFVMNSSNPLTPIQMLASQYRTTTHDTEKQLRSLIKNFIKIKNTQNSTPQPFLQMLSEGKEELLSLKRKLSLKFQQQFHLYDICKKRIHHHEELKLDAEQRKKFEFNSQIIQYLNSKGKFDKAKQLSKALKEQDMFHIQSSLLEKVMKISQNIKDNNLSGLKEWIYQNSHNLYKVQSQIFFQLACCEYINLIMKNQTITACLYLRNSLKDLKLNTLQQKIVQKLTYLLIDPVTSPPRLQIFLSTLQQTFKKCFSEIYLINFNSQLQRNLVVGISSLKTICCCKQETKNAEICPICSQRANKLSQNIPMLTKESSILKCKINQSIMDEQNYPIALPNGYIYSVSGLNQISKGNEYYCVQQKKWFAKGQAKKVFLA